MPLIGDGERRTACGAVQEEPIGEELCPLCVAIGDAELAASPPSMRVEMPWAPDPAFMAAAGDDEFDPDGTPPPAASPEPLASTPNERGEG